MASRVLKRPMFRRGGMANQGIMSGLEDRSGYQEGGGVDVKARAEIEKELYPPTLLGDTSRLLGNVNDFMFNYGARPLGNLANYITGMGEGINTIKPVDSKEKMIDRVMEIRGLTEENPDAAPAPDAVTGEGEKGEGDKGEGEKGTGGTGELTESDLKTVYADLLPMFQETLGVDGDDFKKDAYLQLARFGTNLMAQPGGSLTSAIGRAAEKPLEGVGEIIGAKRAAERRPKELALQAALRETDPGTIGKGVRDLMKLGYSKDAAIKAIVERGGGEATLAAVRARVVDGDADALLEITDNKSDARKIAKQMYKYGIDYADIEGKLPDKVEEYIEGAYYVHKGKLKRHSNGKLYSAGEKGFLVEQTDI
jgi:hypothetical protein